MSVQARFCEQCGAALPQGAAFCEQCGHRVVAPPPRVETPPADRSVAPPVPPEHPEPPEPPVQEAAPPHPVEESVGLEDEKRGRRRAWGVWLGLLALFALVVGALGLVLDRDRPSEGGVEQTPVVQPVDLTGIWYVEIPGTGTAWAEVTIEQAGDRIQGTAIALDGSVQAALSGQVTGRTARWTFSNSLGGVGEGIGTLRLDGRHMDVQVSSGGVAERQILHRGHLPQ